jgi:hypothetical protein
MKRFLMLAALLTLAAGAADAKNCKDPTTHKFIKCPAAASSSAPAMSSMAAASSSKPPKHCVKGKLCGNTCIAMADKCTK